MSVLPAEEKRDVRTAKAPPAKARPHVQAAPDEAEASATPSSSSAEAPAGGSVAFKGYVDGLSHQWRVVGWVRPLLADVERLQVQLIENDSVLDTASANMFRGDLLGAMIGDGKYGFSLKIPQRLFDGSRHTFLVKAPAVAGANLVGKLEVALPNRAPQKVGAGPRNAAELLSSILPARERAEDFDLEEQGPELNRVLENIARIYDQATALGLLYIHVLRRRIDNDGLQTRLTRLSNAPSDMATIISEVLCSEEARTLYTSGSASRFPDIALLEAWTRLRRYT
jgi:hypothetical protein